MTTKIQDLTQKVYQEGVEKANQEAEKIIADAQKEADQIIENAHKKEDEIINAANDKAQEIKKNAESELQLASRQFVSNLKQQITELITTRQVSEPVSESFQDKKFIKNTILTIVENWNPQKPEELNINLLLPKEEEQNIDKFFENKTQELLNAGLEIKFDENLKSGFKIGPKDGNYYISFSDKDFENYFKLYLKEKTKKMIFD